MATIPSWIWRSPSWIVDRSFVSDVPQKKSSCPREFILLRFKTFLLVLPSLPSLAAVKGVTDPILPGRLDGLLLLVLLYSHKNGRVGIKIGCRFGKCTSLCSPSRLKDFTNALSVRYDRVCRLFSLGSGIYSRIISSIVSWMHASFDLSCI